jgi:hypothetical protein
VRSAQELERRGLVPQMPGMASAVRGSHIGQCRNARFGKLTGGMAMWAIPPNDETETDRIVRLALAKERPGDVGSTQPPTEPLVSAGMAWFLQKWSEIPSPETDPAQEV